MCQKDGNLMDQDESITKIERNNKIWIMKTLVRDALVKYCHVSIQEADEKMRGKGIIEQTDDAKDGEIHLEDYLNTQRENYECWDIEILNGESFDNSYAVESTEFHVTIKETEKEYIFIFEDNGTGIIDIADFHAIGHSHDSDKERRKSKGIGFVGQGEKLLASRCFIYAYIETKVEGKKDQASIWWFNYERERIRFDDTLKPTGKVKTKTGTYKEVHILKESLEIGSQIELQDYSNDIEEYIKAYYENNYTVLLLTSPFLLTVNGEKVEAPPLPKPLSDIHVLNIKNDENGYYGKIIISKTKIPKGANGIKICVGGKDIKRIELSDLKIPEIVEVAPYLKGYIISNGLKQIVTSAKNDIQKDKKGLKYIWKDFRNYNGKCIYDWFNSLGYFNEKEQSINKKVMNELYKDIIYMYKNSDVARDIIDSWKSKDTIKDGMIDGDILTPEKKKGKKRDKIKSEIRTGDGELLVFVIDDSETKKKLGTNKESISADTLYEDAVPYKEKVTIRTYVRKSGHWIHLEPDTEIDKVNEGKISIKNHPLNVEILVMAITPLGKSYHTRHGYGRPVGYVILTKDKKSEKVIIPISIKTLFGFDYTKEGGYDISFFKDINEKKFLLVNVCHPRFILSKPEHSEDKHYFHLQLCLAHALAKEKEVDKEKMEEIEYKLIETLSKRIKDN